MDDKQGSWKSLIFDKESQERLESTGDPRYHKEEKNEGGRKLKLLFAIEAILVINAALAAIIRSDGSFFIVGMVAVGFYLPLHIALATGYTGYTGGQFKRESNPRLFWGFVVLIGGIVMTVALGLWTVF